MGRLRCPVDRSELLEQKLGAANIAICRDCGGLWLSPKARMAPSVDPSSLPEVTQKASDASHPLRKYKMCPACGITLISEKIKGIEIDRCTKCDGVWLDAGEYAAVRSRIEIQGVAGRRAKTKNPPITSIRRRDEAKEPEESSGNTTMEALFGIVEFILDILPK